MPSFRDALVPRCPVCPPKSQGLRSGAVRMIKLEKIFLLTLLHSSGKGHSMSYWNTYGRARWQVGRTQKCPDQDTWGIGTERASSAHSNVYNQNTHSLQVESSGTLSPRATSFCFVGWEESHADMQQGSDSGKSQGACKPLPAFLLSENRRKTIWWSHLFSFL